MATLTQSDILMQDNNKPNIIIRPAVETDIPALAKLIGPYVDEGLLLERTYDEFGELLPGFFVAINQDDTIVGCAALEIYSPKLAEIRSLAVSSAAQGMGIGKMLVQACLQRAHENHVFEVMAITTQDAFFQNCGFDYTLPGAKRALFIQTRDQYTNPTDQ